MLIVALFLKSGEAVFSFSFVVSDKSQMPEYFKRAIAAFYGAASNLSLLDPEISIKVDVPKNEDMPLHF